MATLVDAGVSVDAFVMPILPGINDADEDLDELFETLAGVGVRTAICEALFLRSPSKEIFFRFLREHMPEFEAEYRRRYDESAYATPLYVEKLRARVQKLRQKWNLLGPGSRRLAGPSVRISMPRRRQKRLPRERPPSSRLFDQLRLFD
jgi:DNA repair photolyase